ncbi:hypothetical protein [Flagellimonas marinaquae]|uniref:hypothetical protein n=1 Tax=Flagellimonas marinaquae TaxID=254955 RepID=UPI0020763121|nr:hypothetical protein [Allomuricauda aquimarina]USD26876.1 hypothetical protein MJO53_08255 [Allomuricauda aquimarina]
MQEYNDHQELHNHKGTEHYEVTTLISSKNEPYYIQFDSIQKLLIVKSSFDANKGRGFNTYETAKINTLGIKEEAFDDIDHILNDGTMWDGDYYRNWIINGDKTKHKYLDPLTQEEKNDAEKWRKKFISYYNRATYVHESSWSYYMKINKEWFKFKMNLEVINDEFAKQHPPKENEEVRMIKLKDLTPDFFSSEEREKNKGFMELVGYEETEREKSSQILNPIEHSAGHYIINVHLPKGDTLKIRNFGSMYPNLKTYKIPKEHGGRDDVIFMVQEPDQELYPNQKWGGMYVIRPRKMK